MIRFKTLLQRYWPILAGLIVNLSVVVYYIVFNQGVQVFHYDMIEQGLAFISRGYDLIRVPGLTWWDWNHFLGANVFVHGFYFIFSPFWLIYSLLPDKTWIPYAALYVNMLKHVLLFITSALYFRSISKQNLSVYVGASIYTFSGFALGYYNYAHFTDVLLFVPLVLLFIEQYLNQQKVLGLVLTIAVMYIINPYLAILFTPYIFIYALFRHMVIYPIKLNQLILNGLRFSALFAMGFGLSSFIALPHLQILLSSSRLASETNYFGILNRLDVFRYITSFLQPVVDRNDFNPLISKFVVPSYGHSGGAAVYSLIISPLLVPLLVFFKKNKTVVGLMILYTLGLVFSFFPNLYFLVQGNNDTRWMVYFIFLNGFTVVYILDNLHRIKRELVLLSAIFISALLLVSYFYSRSNQLHTLDVYYDIAKRNIIILGCLIVFYSLTLFMNHKKLTVAVIALTVSLDSYLALYNIFLNPVPSVSMSKTELESYRLDDVSYIEHIKSLDESVYRVDVREPAGFNNSMSKNYMGLAFYSSVYNYHVDAFIQNHLSSAGGWIVGGNEGKWLYKMMYGSKYLVSINSQTSIPYGYRRIHSMSEDTRYMDIYVNEYHVPLLYGQVNEVSYEVWNTYSALEKMRTLLSNVVVNQDDKRAVSTQLNTHTTVLGTFSDQVIYQFDATSSNAILTIEYPRSEEVFVTVKLKNQIVAEHYAYEPHYSSLYIQAEFDAIEIKVSNLYGVPAEEFINKAHLEYPDAFYPSWYEGISNNFVQDIVIGQNTFSGQISLDKPMWIVSSIAYDRSWNIKANEKPIDFENVNGGFIGFKLEAGDYIIVGNYQPKDIGLSVSTSVISSLCLYYFIKKRYHLLYNE